MAGKITYLTCCAVHGGIEVDGVCLRCGATYKDECGDKTARALQTLFEAGRRLRRWERYLPMPLPVCVLVLVAAYVWMHVYAEPFYRWVFHAMDCITNGTR